MPPEAVLREVKAWAGKAENDLQAAQIIMMAPGALPYDIVCFHAQQAAEKYLKALLTFYGIPFPRTHDLPELALRLPADSTATCSVGDLSELADAAVSARYPDDLVAYDRPLAERLLRKAEIVRDAVKLEMASQGYSPP